MYKTILVPTDFSDEGSTVKTLQNANTLSSDGRIILLHVLDESPSIIDVQDRIKLIKELIPRVEEKLKEMIESSKVKAEVEVRNGSPNREIIESAKNNEADLIIINSHQPGLQDYLLGSTAARVVRHAPSSVLVVR